MLRTVVLVAMALTGIPAVWCQSIQPPYASSYTLVTLGTAPGVPMPYGALAFLDESNVLLGGNGDGASGAIYTVPVTRDSNGHVIALGNANRFASAPYIDGGLVFGPEGVLFATGSSNTLLEFKPGSTTPDDTVGLTPLGVTNGTVGGVQFVPPGMPGAGRFKIVTFNGQWYDATLTQNASGTYDVSSVTAVAATGGGAEGEIYVPPGSPQFSSPSILVCNDLTNEVDAYTTDSNGNPVLTGAQALADIIQAVGAMIDPITGDALFTKFNSSSSALYEVQGFTGSSVAASSGWSQSAIVHHAFAIPLTVLVSDPYGAPLNGITVNFAAPGAGASATISSTSAVTGSNGEAKVTATANATEGSYTVTATLYGKSATFPLTNVALESETLSPTSVVGGNSTAANTVTLTSAAPSNGATITLTSSNPTAAAVPASVTVAGGAMSSPPFTISTAAVAALTHVTITASGAGQKSATLSVRPAALTALKLSPKSVVGGKSTTANNVMLSGMAPAGGAVVSLLSSDPTVATVPDSITVAAGDTTSPAFTVTTTAVAAQTPVTISATLAGVTKTGTLTVDSPQVASLKLSPASVTGGHPTTNNTVTLNGPAPAGGAAVMLTSGNSEVAAVPLTVTVAAGAMSATFKITTTVVSENTVVPITATFGGASKMANLTVTP